MTETQIRRAANALRDRGFLRHCYRAGVQDSQGSVYCIRRQRRVPAIDRKLVVTRRLAARIVAAAIHVHGLHVRA